MTPSSDNSRWALRKRSLVSSGFWHKAIYNLGAWLELSDQSCLRNKILLGVELANQKTPSSQNLL
jgi:hypothetical protein